MAKSSVIFANGLLQNAGNCLGDLILAKQVLENTSTILDQDIINANYNFVSCNKGNEYCLELNCGKTARLNYAIGQYEFLYIS